MVKPECNGFIQVKLFHMQSEIAKNRSNRWFCDENEAKAALTKLAFNLRFACPDRHPGSGFPHQVERGHQEEFARAALSSITAAAEHAREAGCGDCADFRRCLYGDLLI
jgi:hypothetical protein